MTAGISIINVGFPDISEGEKHNVKRIVNETFKNATSRLRASHQRKRGRLLGMQDKEK
jgi:isopropylmalate/homocitrate/citramalate synthase